MFPETNLDSQITAPRLCRGLLRSSSPSLLAWASPSLSATTRFPVHGRALSYTRVQVEQRGYLLV